MKKILILFLFFGAVLTFIMPVADAQVRVPFEPRTSSAAQNRTIYNIRGDYTIIGNTNMTRSSGSGDNSNASMRYINADKSNQRLNSSSAFLQFSNEDGADAACTKVIYAGLYWTGRAHDANTSAHTFSVSKNVQGGSSTSTDVNSDQSYSSGSSITNGYYTVAMSRVNNSNSDRYPRYTFTADDLPTILFEFRNGTTNRVWYSLDNGDTWVNIPGSVSDYVTSGSGNSVNISTTFTPITIFSEANGVTITVSGLKRTTSTTGNTNEYANAIRNQITVQVTGKYYGAATVTKTLDKHVVQLRHGSTSSYTQIVAAANNFTENIYYPSGGSNPDGVMYSAYADVTEYVKQYGEGDYFVADIALREGNGGGTGYYGGWGMVVIYENAQMKWRDISVFDGHAYVAGSTTRSYDLPVSGFHAVQQGDVNVKLGLMAGEGDNSISGDYFRIYNRTQGAFDNLSHGGNTTNNFFNSSIYTGGNARNPNLSNNTGMDIAMFQINNANKQYITNDQTSTTFRYGSTQDTYVIFCIVVGIDAYIPEPEVENAAVNVRDKDGNPVNPVNGTYIVEPGYQIDYLLQVRNRSTEGVDNLVINFPLPYTTKFVSANTEYQSIPNGTFAYDQSAGPSGTIVWNVGNIPESIDPTYVYATLDFTLEITEDCDVLSSVGSCVPGVVIEGSVSGVGNETGISFSDLTFVYGFHEDCEGTPITDPPKIEIDISNHECGGHTTSVRTITACTQGSSIPYNVVAENFPRGTRFYNVVDEATGQPPVNATEYTAASGFPTESGVTYYAVPSSISNTCYWSFKLVVSNPPSFTVGEGLVCQSETIDLKTLVGNITPTSSDVKYYANAAATDEIASIVTPEVQTTYYVRSYTTGYACNSTITPVVVKVTPRATETTITANTVNICTGSTASLSASAPGVGNPIFRWYANQTDDTPLYEGPDFTTGILTTEITRDTIFYVSVKGEGLCENLPGSRKEVAVTITELPVLTITTANGNPDALCHNSTIDIVATNTGVITWIGWYDKNGSNDNSQFSPRFVTNPTGTVNTSTYNPDQSEAGTTVKLYVRANGGVCPYVADTIRLTILPAPDDAAFELITQPTTFQEMCTDTIYELKVKATDPGDLYNMEIMLHDVNANQIAIKDAEIKYPYTTSVWEPLTVKSSGLTGTTWSLPGTLPHGDSLLFRVTVAAECDFFSGTGVNFNFKAAGICGEELNVDPVSTLPFYTKQDTAKLNTYDVSGEFSHNVVNNHTGDTVTWRLTAVVKGDQPTDSDKETMVVLVPAGLSAVPDSYRPIKNAPGRSSISTIIDEYGVEFGLPVMSDLVEGDSIIAELKFHASGAPCGEYEFYSEIIFSDEVLCRDTMCTFYSTRGGYYPTLEVERYIFSINDTITGIVVNNLWSAQAKIQARTPFFEGDSILIDFYIDRDNDNRISENDTMVHHHKYLTEDVDEGDFFFDYYIDIPVEGGRKLLALAYGNSICDSMVIPLGVLTGQDQVCRYDTTMYYTSPGMTLYKWEVDGVSGASPIRIPVDGETEVTAVPYVARIVWRHTGDFHVWTQYTIPGFAVDGSAVEVGKTYFPVRVNPLPVLSLVAADTTVCEGTQVELTHFFRDDTKLEETTILYYKQERDGSFTLLGDMNPLYVKPPETTTYRAIATCGPTGCASDPVDFRVIVRQMPQIASVHVVSQPACGAATGSIHVAVAGGSGSYRYSLNGEAAYADLPATGIVGNLPAGNYTVYLKDETETGCPASISAPVSVSPSSGLFVIATATDAPTCAGEGTISVVAYGGKPPYQYSVNDGAYIALPRERETDGSIGNFPPGQYRINIKDAADCIVAADLVTIKVVAGLNLALEQTETARCDERAPVKVTVSGGTAPYSYRSNGKGWVAMTAYPDSLYLGAGMHDVWVRDAAGCETTGSITVTTGSALTASADVTDATCNGAKPGSVGLTINGGTGQLKYSIDGGKTTVNISSGTVTIPNVSVGNYQILLTDETGCVFVLEGIEMGTEYDFIHTDGNYINTYKNTPTSGYVIYNDFDYLNQKLSFKEQIHDAQHGTITEFNPTTFRVGYTPHTDFVGTDSLEYVVTNTCGMESNTWLVIYVWDTIPVNRPPLALTNEYALRRGDVLADFEVRNNDKSFDGALKNPVAVTLPENGTLTQKPDGTFTYTPYPNYAGLDMFTYEVCDENDSCATAHVNIAIYETTVYDNNVLAAADAYQVEKYDTLKITSPALGVLGNDRYQNGSPQVEIKTNAQHGDLTMNSSDGTFTYIPDKGYSGRDVFLYRVCTGSKCDSVYASIFITERPCPATFTVQDTIEVCDNDSVALISAILPPTENIDTIAFFADREHLVPITGEYAKTQNGYIYIGITSVYGCDVADSVYLKVLQSPADPVIDTASDEACTGDEIYFSVTANEDYDYQWAIVSGGGDMKGLGQDHYEYFTWTTTGQKEVSVTVTNGDGCTKTAEKVVVVIPRAKSGPIYRTPNR